MSLKIDIDKIFKENTDYANPSQAVNQASSLNALSGDLYTDSKRFIYELLQNADDSSTNGDAVEVWIKIIDSNLIVAHSGCPFSSRDLRGICNINNGTKKSDLTKTGYKGIGFKSVFGQSDKVTIYSNGDYFRFDASYSFEWKQNWEVQKEEWEKNNDRKFQFPWQIIPIYTEANEITAQINLFIKTINANVATIIKMKNAEETSQAIQDLSQNPNMFIFLKNIRGINFDTTKLVNVKIDRTRKDRIILQKEDSPQIDWIINTITLRVPDEVKDVLQEERNIPEKLLNTDSIEMSFAARVGRDGITKLSNHEKLLYSYLPTDETKYSLPVLVNTSFLTSANRESLHVDSKWNQWLFKAIAIQIFKWIAELVNTEFQFQAYQLIPQNTFDDGLGKKFNEGIKEALKSIPFIISREGQLVKIQDTIVDFTYLSEKKFIGEESIKNFILKGKENQTENYKWFAKSSDFFLEFKRLGSSCFEWKDLLSFFSSSCFIKFHTINYNIDLIKHFKKLCESDKVKGVSQEVLKEIPFIWDHKNHINYPYKVCFPTADDQNWDNPNSDLSFLHQDLQAWLHKDLESRQWLENLGVQEKTDITYITQNIIPNIDSYITPKNAMKTIQDLFNLYRKEELKEGLLKDLSRIKLLTRNGSLLSANECYLSDFYDPRLQIEKTLKKDIFISEEYCCNIHEKDEWKRFFKILGASEGTDALIYKSKNSKSDCMNSEISCKYFDEIVSKTPISYTGFSIDSIGNIASIKYIDYIENNYKLSLEFWKDYIEHFTPEKINITARGYWGYSGMDGQISGKIVDNYIPWFIKNINCIPTLMGNMHTSSDVFLNIEEIKDIAGKYLPVFNGVQLTQDWKSFFNFKASFEVSDYLELLDKISKDVDDNGYIKDENCKRIQSVYSLLLTQCTNWSTDEIEKVAKWSTDGHLLNTKNQFTECRFIKYFVDGNEAIFQDQYYFMRLSAENKQNPNLEKLLIYFNVRLLKQSEFELLHAKQDVCSELRYKLESIVLYLKIWIENDDGDTEMLESIENLSGKIELLDVFQTKELKIAYKGINFVKNVNVHFNATSLFVTNPWNSNSVLLKLSDVLCRYFDLIGHEKKLDFLLRSTDKEIQKYFIQENIQVPDEILGSIVDLSEGTKVDEEYLISNINNIATEERTLSDFHDKTKHDYSRQQYIEGLIPRAVENVLMYLKRLPEYDCSCAYIMAKTIIGGIIKNGNEITVIARPSDDDKIRLHYDAEFDVLEYVDAELWYEDGITPPKQFKFGQLLKMTQINKIPIKNIDAKNLELDELLRQPKSKVLDFNAVPYAPEKISRIISSFANTGGGALLFGLKSVSDSLNEVVGVSTEFRMDEITNRAISRLTPIPLVTYDWIKSGENSIFAIKTEKSNVDILLNEQKYIREGSISKLDGVHVGSQRILNEPIYKRTIAIVIAIENYFPKQRNPIPPVKYASNDAEMFKEALLSRFDVDENDIYVLKNEQALKTEIEDVVKYQIFSMTEEDRLIFYYVGHGFHNGVTNYLSSYDMSQWDIANTAIPLRKLLLDPSKQSKCKNAIIFIDACAQSFTDENMRSIFSNISDEELMIFSNDFPYYAVFLSCQAGEKSYSCNNLKNGIWTYHLIEAINGNIHEAVRANKYITDRTLGDYLSCKVSDYAKNELGYDQNPKAILDASYENVIIEIKNEII